MVYELQIFNNEMGANFETVEVEGNGYFVTDGVDSSLFTVVGKRNVPVFVVPLARVRQMRAKPPSKAVAPIKVKNLAKPESQRG